MDRSEEVSFLAVFGQTKNLELNFCESFQTSDFLYIDDIHRFTWFIWIWKLIFLCQSQEYPPVYQQVPTFRQDLVELSPEDGTEWWLLLLNLVGTFCCMFGRSFRWNAKGSNQTFCRSIQLFLFNPLEPFRFVMDDFSWSMIWYTCRKKEGAENVIGHVFSLLSMFCPNFCLVSIILVISIVIWRQGLQS